MAGYLTTQEIHQHPDRFAPVGVLITEKDVATVLDSLRSTLEECPSEHIVDIVQDDERYYYCVVDFGICSEFDFYAWLGKKYRSLPCRINCVNVNLLFPRELSRGVNRNPLAVDGKEDYNDYSLDEGEEATGFMDEDELDDLMNRTAPKLLYEKGNCSIPIPYTHEGITIGRSSKKSDFQIKDNENVSRLHCRVYMDGDSLKVRDEDSKNGTYVNGSKVVPGEDVVLFPGDTLFVADEKFKCSR